MNMQENKKGSLRGPANLIDGSYDPNYTIFANQLIAHCEKTGIDWEEVKYSNSETLKIYIDNGKRKRGLNFFSVNSLQEALKADLGGWVFLGDYRAAIKYELDYIEASISISTTNLKWLSDYDRLGWLPLELSQEHDGKQIKIQIGDASENFIPLSNRRQRRRFSLKIFGTQKSNHDDALAILNKISGALFFQIDLQFGSILSLQRFSAGKNARLRRADHSGQPVKLKFPDYEYDFEALSLYWYARSAEQMPLLQFLSFYQVIEYYYPIYAYKQAQIRIRDIIKDPTFRPDRDADIGKILALTTAKNAAFGSEREQLHTTIAACCEEDELRQFIKQEPLAESFFAKPDKRISSNKISANESNPGFINEVAARIYDIRCKIVHTKNDGHENDAPMLLPFSEEAEMLEHDISIMSYIARKVIISSSSPMRI